MPLEPYEAIYGCFHGLYLLFEPFNHHGFRKKYHYSALYYWEPVFPL